jgi:hypothetical protein
VSHLHGVAGDFYDGVEAGGRVSGGQDEELVRGLIQERWEACHRIVPEMQVIDEATKELGHDRKIVLLRLERSDVEAGSGNVAGPYSFSGVAGLLGYSGELVAQIRKTAPDSRSDRRALAG